VLSRSEYHQGGKNQPSYTLYIVELRHPDPKKAVRLFVSKSDLGFRAIWEDYCRQLNVPAVELDGGKLVKRDVADLDKSVKELVKEGKVNVDFDPSKPPPDGLVLRINGNILELTVVKKSPSIGLVIALLVPCVFIYIGFFVEGCPVAFGVFGAVFLVLFVLGGVWSVLAKDHKIVGKDEIRLRQSTPWGASEVACVSAETIEQVRIGSKAGNGRNAVLLETDGATIEVGAGLSAESLEWLKNCIVRVISV
jgi:hypothetical protein